MPETRALEDCILAVLIFLSATHDPAAAFAGPDQVLKPGFVFAFSGSRFWKPYIFRNKYL